MIRGLFDERKKGKNRSIVLVGVLGISLAGMAQGEYDAMKYSQLELNGSARFVGMGGAFGALGGEMSAISVNPAGLAVYRSSELAFTPAMYATTPSSRFNGTPGDGDMKVNAKINRFGYVGSFRINNESV